jgi:penicillin-binding protein 2
MGFGYKLGVDLPSEKRGFIPNSEYYTKVKRTDKWVAQNVISIAIGQGEVLATPLQVANWAATLANRGYFYTPHVVKEVKDMPLDKKYTQKHDTGLSSDAYYHIVEGMRKAVIGGTCHAANVQGLDICGKTGTAQNPHGQDHSIFMGFAPKDDPKVAIFIIVENGKWGATFGVPMGRLMIEKYLLGEIPASDIDLENRMAKAKVQTRQTAWQ